MRLGQRARTALIGTCAVIVALVAIAFAVGGSQSEGTSNNGLTAASSTGAPGDVAVGGAPEGLVPGIPAPADAPVAARELAPTEQTGGSTTAGSSGGKVAADAATSFGSGSSLAATRIVKTGNLTIRVDKERVQSVTQLLSSLATSQGGYVAQSNTSLDTRNPYGEIVLRVPVAHFQAAITAAQKLGDKVLSLTTSADDVTGKFVDLNARKHALERTRQTYLTILSRARTIGETLSVQQRIDEVQQQLDQLHGQLKLLNNQSSYSTLTVYVVPAGGDIFTEAAQERDGIDKAWHDSWSRFGRGVNAIVGAIGPIVFALLLIAVLGLIGWGGYRGVRRVTARDQAAS